MAIVVRLVVDVKSHEETFADVDLVAGYLRDIEADDVYAIIGGEVVGVAGRVDLAPPLDVDEPDDA